MREIIATANAPAAIGPYSQAVKVGQLLFLSGQIPLDPKSGQLVTNDIEKETEQVMQNLNEVLKAAQMTFANVVRCTIYLTDLGHFTQVNAVYGRYFTSAPPARATVQVAGLPKGARVEIDAIAVAV